VFSNLSLLNRLEEPWKADAARKPETKTSGVDWRVSLKSCGLAKSVVGLAEGDTRAAACDQASINRVEASEESARPAIWASGWLGDNLWLVDGILESSDPKRKEHNEIVEFTFPTLILLLQFLSTQNSMECLAMEISLVKIFCQYP
jgi:hypothetical protein